MHTVNVTRVIDVPADEAWRLLDDFGAVYRYHPTVVESPIQNGISSGLGAERACLFDDGGMIREAITAYAPGREYTVEIVDPGKYPLKSAQARMSVQPEGEGRALVGFEMAFVPKGGPLGWLMAKVMMEPQFKRILNGVLQGLETHALTGEIVSRKPTATSV